MGLFPNLRLILLSKMLTLHFVLSIGLVTGISTDFGQLVQDELELNDDRVLKIFDGSIASTSYPFMVAIVMFEADTPQLLCGASLVDETHILTAGHCSVTINETLVNQERLEGWIGVRNLKNFTGPKIPISRVVPHPNFKPRPILQNDIAIVGLQYPVPRDDLNRSRTICVGTREDYDGVNVTLIGFGNYDCFNGSSQLRIASGQAMDNTECQRRGHKKKLLESQLCAELENPEHRRAEQAPGDSGGPLFFQMDDGNFVQVGSVSYNYIRDGKKDEEGNPRNPCPNLDIPGVYTLVGAYEEFIKSVASKVKFCN